MFRSCRWRCTRRREVLSETQCEQMSSGLPLKADIAQCSRHVSKVPIAEMIKNCQLRLPNPAKTSAPINVTTANTIRARKNLAMLEQRPQGYFVRNPS